MAIQIQAGQRVPISRDEFKLMLQNGELYKLSYEQVKEAAKCHIEDIVVQFRQDNMRRSERLRQVSDLVDFANGNATSIVTRGALGFGDMWSKGLSFMDLMYVKLLTAISILAVFSEQAAKNKKVEQQRSDMRHEPVNGVCDNLSQLGYNLDSLNQMVSRMKGQIMTSDNKHDPTNFGVWHLCNKDGHKISGKAQGLKALADNLFPEDGSVGSDSQPRRLTRIDTVMHSS